MISLHRMIGTVLYMLLLCFTPIAAQNKLPLKKSVALGAGIGTGLSSSDQITYLNKYKNPLLKHFSAEGIFHFQPFIDLGIEYNLLESNQGNNSMTTHSIGPFIGYRYLFNESRNAFGITTGVNYFNYRDHLHTLDLNSDMNQSYAGVSFALAYEFLISKSLSGKLKLQFQMADFFVNENYSEYQDEYNKKNLLDNNLSFIGMTLSLQFGK